MEPGAAILTAATLAPAKVSSPLTYIMIKLLMSLQVAYRQTIEERIAQQGGIQGEDDSLWSDLSRF